jgi:hypothetical protein
MGSVDSLVNLSFFTKILSKKEYHMIQKIKEQWFLTGVAIILIAVYFDPTGILVTAGLI